MYDRLMAVSRGCRLVWVGLAVVVGAAVFGFLGGTIIGAVAGANADPDDPPDPTPNVRAVPGMLVLLLAEGLLRVFGRVVGLVGRLQCRAVPRAAENARGLATASAALEGGAVVLDGCGIVVSATGLAPSPAVSLAIGGTGHLLSLGSLALFLLFGRAFAEYARRPRLGERAGAVLWLAVAAAGCVLLGFGLMVGGVAAGGAAPAGVCGGAIFMLAAVGLLVWLVVRVVPLANDLSAAAAKQADRYADEDDHEDDGDDWDDADDRPRRR